MSKWKKIHLCDKIITDVSFLLARTGIVLNAGDLSMGDMDEELVG